MTYSEIPFAKLHGVGNDFLILKAGENLGAHLSLASLAVRLCDRHRGIGADGILCYHRTVQDGDADFSALMINADGSRVESPVTVETDLGSRAVEWDPPSEVSLVGPAEFVCDGVFFDDVNQDDHQ